MKKVYITKSGAFIRFSDIIEVCNISSDDDMAIKKVLNSLSNYFTIKYESYIGGKHIERKFASVKYADKYILLPRYGIFNFFPEPIHDCIENLSSPRKLPLQFDSKKYKVVSQIPAGDNLSIEAKWSGELTENQKVISEYIMENIYTKERVDNGSAGLILNLEAGQGKSYLAAYMISKIQKKTLIILHTVSLLAQWEKVIKKCYPDLTVGTYYHKKKKPGDIMLMIINSSLRDTFEIDKEELDSLTFFNQFGFCIIDECHLFNNNMGKEAYSMIQSRYMLGLSATPNGHKHGFDVQACWYIGNILCANRLPGFSVDAHKFEATIKRVMYYGPKSHTKLLVNAYTGDSDTTGTISMICDDHIRSQMVVDKIKECYKGGYYTYVFADRRTYLEHLRSMFIEQLNITDEETSIEEDFVKIVGGSTQEKLDIAESKSRVIFTTYQYSGTGRSIVKMNASIFATPRRSNITQYANRIFRLGSEPTRRIIYDIVDMKINIKNQWSTRKDYYKSMNYDIEEEKINFSDVKIPKITRAGNSSNTKEPPPETLPDELSKMITAFKTKLQSTGD